MWNHPFYFWNNLCSLCIEMSSKNVSATSMLFGVWMFSFFAVFFFFLVFLISMQLNLKKPLPMFTFISHMLCLKTVLLFIFQFCVAVPFNYLVTCHIASATSALSLWWYFLSVCFFHRSLTSNLPNVNLPNVNLPKIPNLPVNLPQMPSISTPSWMAAIYDSECVLSSL